jgi:hypothetical protein
MSQQEFTRLRHLSLQQLIKEPIDKLMQLNLNLRCLAGLASKKGDLL